MINKDLIIIVGGITLEIKWVVYTQDEMFLGYFIGHDESFVSRQNWKNILSVIYLLSFHVFYIKPLYWIHTL